MRQVLVGIAPTASIHIYDHNGRIVPKKKSNIYSIEALDLIKSDKRMYEVEKATSSSQMNR